MHRIVRVGRAQDVFVALRPSQSQLLGPRDSPGSAEELGIFRQTYDRLGLLQIANELDIGVTEGRSILVVVVADLMSSGFDLSNQFWVKQSPFANQEEGSPSL